MNKGFLAAAVLFAAGCGGGLAHTKVVDPNVVAKVSGLEKIGTITSVRHAGGMVYAAGATGLAGISADGKVLWTLELPAAENRLIEADEQGIAVSSYDLAGVDRATGLNSFIQGSVGDEPICEHQTLAYVTKDGKLAWSVAAEQGKTAISAPGMSADQIAVSRGKGFFAHARSDGHQLFAVELAGGDATEGQILNASYNRPVFVNGNWYAAHLNHLVRVDPAGKLQDDSRTFGLFSPFQKITAGPLAVGDHVVFGNSPWTTDEPARLFATDKGGDSGWNEKLNKDKSGAGALAKNANAVFVATNFSLAAYTPDGSQLWSQKNGKGGLYHGRLRGVRYSGNAFSSTFATRKSQTQQLVATDARVFVTSAYHEGDALTVLDAKTGAYVASIDVKAPVIDLAVVGESLAVATPEGLELISVQ